MCFLTMAEESPLTIGDEDNGILGVMSISRFRMTIPEVGGVTVRICINRGAIMVYGSYTVPNPNAALHHFSDFLRATRGVVTPFNCSVSHVTIDDGTDDCSENQRRKKRQEEEEEEEEGEEARIVVVHITIEGVSDTENQFSISSSNGSAFGEDNTFNHPMQE